MAKISNEELKLMLTVSTSEAQNSLQAMEIEAKKLSSAYKETQKAIRENEKEARSLEKQMAKLADKGKENTDQYRQLADQYARNFEAARKLTAQAGQQEKAIKNNSKAQKDLLDSMKLSEMTTVQLQKRQKELQDTLKNTQPNTKAWKQLNSDLHDVESQMQSNQNSAMGMMESLSSIPSPMSKIGQVVQSIKKAFDVLKAHPFLLIGAAVAGILQSIKMGIEQSDELRTKFAGVVGAVQAGLKELTNIVGRTGEAITRFFTGDFAGAKSAIADIKDLAKGIEDAGKAAYRAAILEDQYNDIIGRNSDLQKINNAEIAQLSSVVKDQTKSLEERQKAMQRINKLTLSNYKKQRDEIIYNYNVWVTKNDALMKQFRAAAPEEMKMLKENIEAVRDGSELTFEQMRKMAVAVNKVTTETDHATEEEKAQYRKFFSDLSLLQQGYFSEQKARTRENNSIIKEAKAAEAEAAKNAAKANIDAFKTETERLKKEYTERTLSLTQQYAAQELSKDEYDHYIRQSEELLYTEMLQKAKQYGQDATAIEQKLAEIQIARNERMKKDTKEISKALNDQKDALQQVSEVAAAAAGAMQSGLGKDLMQTVNSVTDGITKIGETLNNEALNASEKAAGITNAIAGSITQGLQATSQMMHTIFDMEASALTEAKNKELAAVGDNEEEKQRIEQEYAEKELELKKKQANADAAISSANLWVSTAQGITAAWAAAMKYGPIAGPIIGSTLSALMLAMAGVQQAAIIKQRNAITSQTLESSSTSSGSGSSSSSGGSVDTTAALKDEYSTMPTNGSGAGSGGGYADGGYTGNGGRLQVAGVVHKGEYVVAQPELHRPMVANMVKQIEGLRRQRLANGGGLAGGYAGGNGYASGNGYAAGRNGGNYVAGFADGGYTSVSSPEIKALIQELRREPLRATVNYQELQHAAERIRRAKG